MTASAIPDSRRAAFPDAPMHAETNPNPEGRCSICGAPSDDLAGGWGGPWEAAVWIELCPACRGEDE